MSDTMELQAIEPSESAAEPIKKRSLTERGMATVEYVIGILAAAAVALLLLRIFNDNAFFKYLFDYVVGMIKSIPLPK